MKMGLKLMSAALGIFLLTASAGAEDKIVLKTQKAMQSYAMGVEVLKSFNRQQFDYDLDIVIQGMKDAAAGGQLLMSDRALQGATDMTTTDLRRKKTEVRVIAQQENKKKGEEFLAENKMKEGVISLPSGLQYKIIRASDGRKPTEADTVECRLRGSHIDGTEFENSDLSGKLATLKVSEVIPAWREALKLMPVGSKWQLFIPSQLAYVQRGSGKIGPYETTIYEIELVAIK